MMKEQGRLTVEELLQVKWLMGGLLALLSLWSLFSLSFGSEWMLMAGVLAVGFALLRPQAVTRIPRRLIRWAGPAILLFIALDFVLNIPRLPEFMPPLVRMVVLLLLYRIYAPRRKREDLQLILLCLFCLVISGVLTVSLLFAVQILLFAPGAMALLFVVCLLDRGSEQAEGPPQWTNFQWHRLLRRVWSVLDLKVVALGAVMFLFMVLVSSLLFVLTPRFNIDQTLPFLEVSGQARSGFSETVELGEVSEIKEDNRLALQVDLPSLEALGSMPYWRMLVLDHYENGGFRMSPYLQSPRQMRRSMNDTRRLSGWGTSSDEYADRRWVFYLEGGVSKYLPLLGPYQTLRFEEAKEVEEIKELRIVNMTKVLQQPLFYEVQGLEPTNRFPAAPAEWRSFGEPLTVDEDAELFPYPETTRVLNLSPEDRDVLRALNAEIHPGGEPLSAARFSELITGYLRKNFFYSLRPDGLKEEDDPIVSWLRHGSRGHCELYAGAFILLARQAGYPARMVVGFAGGTWNPVEEFFAVRNRDAHAWVEIYDAATREWLRVDPTPGNGPSDPDVEVPGTVAFDTGWSAWMESLRIQWYRRIVNFDQQDQMSLADSALAVAKDWFRAGREALREWLAAFRDLLREPFSKDGFGFGLVFVSVAATLWFGWRLRYWFGRAVAHLLRRSRQLDPVRKQAGRYLRKAREQQAREDGDRSAAASEPLARVRGELERLRFGPETPVRQARQVFARARQVLRTRG